VIHLRRIRGIKTAVAEIFEVSMRDVINVKAIAIPEGFKLDFNVLIRGRSMPSLPY